MITNHRTIRIRKANGEEEDFDPQKLFRSLKNSGTSDEIAIKVTEEITRWVYNGATTEKIFRRAFQRMQKLETISAARYRLKDAFFEMGPTGHPFEIFCGLIFKKLGFQVQVAVVVDGCCIQHEMDVIATKDREQWLCECKYTQDKGKNIGIQVPLYVKSRVEDIVFHRKKKEEYQSFQFRTCVITNNRFSFDSIDYAKCVGLQLIAWDYPKGMSLKELVEQFRLFPITTITSLSSDQKQKLLNSGVVACSQILENREILETIGLSKRQIKKIIAEATTLCE